ncbi:MAG: hypothetical protein QG675_81 [Patescibacteria group bacterium]|jgi:hypothetical protein|nr:hypothetical protein [Patescibacteria group bacterium]
MGQYKVPQNVETEDKILGPLSVKQFIYVIIALMWAFLMWRLFSSYLIVALIAAFPVTGFFLLLGFGQREGVPFEDYVVAFIRFLIVPRKRMWIKDDSKEVIVQDTEKPKDDINMGKNVSTGQLKKLANIIDTRGNYKDPSISLSADDNEAEVYAARIIGPAQVGGSTAAAQAGVLATQSTTVRDDVLDQANPRSEKVAQMLVTAEEVTHDNAVRQVNQALQQNANGATSSNNQASTPQQQQSNNPAQNIAAASEMLRKTVGLPVQRVAEKINQQQLVPGNSVQLKK